MALDPTALPPGALAFLAERHLATLTTLRADGSPHVVPVGISFDAASGVARVITFEGAQKYRNACRGGRAVLCQVDGRRWLSLEGPVRAVPVGDPAVAEAVAGYTARYRPPKERVDRVAVEIAVDRILGRA